MNVQNIGENAGIVWRQLASEHRKWQYDEVKAATGLADRDLNAAIGWLAREGRWKSRKARWAARPSSTSRCATTSADTACEYRTRGAPRGVPLFCVCRHRNIRTYCRQKEIFLT